METDTTSTRDRLLDAAARVFVEHGYWGASMEQVRQAAGVSNGSLYHHFPTKSQLADALYVETLHDFHAQLLAPIARSASAEAGVKGMVRAHINWVLKNPGRASLLHKLKREGDVTDASAGVSSANAQAFAALRQWVHAQMESGEMREMPFYVWMAVAFSPAMSLTGRWVRDADSPVPQKVRAALEHAAWMAVAP
jgi:AcrR family transcriptional regulator